MGPSLDDNDDDDADDVGLSSATLVWPALVDRHCCYVQLLPLLASNDAQVAILVVSSGDSI